MADKIGTNLPDSSVLYYADPGREPDAELLAAFDHGEGAPKNSSDGGLRNSKYRLACIRSRLANSLARKLVSEMCRFFPRILALRSLPTGTLYRCAPVPTMLGSKYKYGFESSEDIQRLLADHPWAGDLDAEIAGKAYALGAAWALGNLNSDSRSDTPAA